MFISRLIDALIGWLTVGAFVVGFLLVNGGYIYRTTCPVASGSQTTWTYGIYDILPYIRQTSSPCESHTATRVVLDKVGVWEISSAATAEPATPEDAAAASRLAQVTRDIVAEFARQRSEVEPLTEAADAGTLSEGDRAEALDIIVQSQTRLEAIKAKVDEIPEPADPQLIEAQQLLSQWLAYQVAANEAFMSASSTEDFEDRATRIASSLGDVVQRLRPVAAEVEARYPSADWDWAFLPRS